MKTRKPIKLSQLKGINIYFQDDFYQTAKLLLTLYDAKREHFNETGITRPTVHGLIRTFADMTDPLNPKTEYVKSVVEKKKWPANATIIFDEEA